MEFGEWRKQLLSPESVKRSEAAEQLPDTGQPSEIQALLVNTLNDPDSLVRVSGAETLGLVDSDSARAGLRHALSVEKDEMVRGYVASSLGAIGHLPDLKLLVDETLNATTTPWQKLHCAQGIVLLALNYALTLIVTTIKDESLKLGAPGFASLEVILNQIDASRICILDLAKERQGQEYTEIERENIRSVLAKLRPSK